MDSSTSPLSTRWKRTKSEKSGGTTKFELSIKPSETRSDQLRCFSLEVSRRKQSDHALPRDCSRHVSRN